MQAVVPYLCRTMQYLICHNNANILRGGMLEWKIDRRPVFMTLVIICRIVCSLPIVFMTVEHLIVYLKVTTLSSFVIMLPVQSG